MAVQIYKQKAPDWERGWVALIKRLPAFSV